MQHGPAVELGKDNSIPMKQALGIKLFFVYLLFYLGFIFVGLLSPDSMSIQMFSGLNLAYIYGMGLIVMAIVMGLAYNHFCTKYENLYNKEDKQ